MIPDLDALFATPSWHCQRFDSWSAHFVAMDRASYRESAFLDRRATMLSDQPMTVPLDRLVRAAADEPVRRIGWIFHLAHCGSTFLSRLIDGASAYLVLREPPPLRQVALASVEQGGGASIEGKLVLARAMAARRYDQDKPTIVKANVPVNFILDPLARLSPDDPAILLYSPLEPYLLAILRSPNHRLWIERICEQLKPALASATGLGPGASIAEKAAALWLAQLSIFTGRLAKSASAQSLDATTLFQDPLAAGLAAARHLEATDVDVEGNAASLAGRYAKDLSQPFDPRAKRDREQEDRKRLADELSAGRRWIERSGRADALPERLERPLVGEAPRLLG